MNSRNIIIKPEIFALWLILFLWLVSLSVIGQQTRIDSLQSLLPEIRSDSVKASVLIELSIETSKIDSSTASSYRNEAIGILKDKGVFDQPDWQYRLASSYYYAGNDYMLIQSSKKAMDGFQKQNRLDEYISSQYDLAYGYFNSGEYEMAIRSLERNLEIGQENNIQMAVCGALDGLGYFYYRLNDYPKSEYYYSSFLNDALNRNDSLQQYLAFSRLGNLCHFKEEYAKAVEYHTKALEIISLLNDSIRYASLAIDLGEDYYYQNEMDKALHFYTKALNVYKSNQNFRGIKFSLTNLGNLYFKQKDYPNALKYYQEALENKKGLSATLLETDLLKNISEVYEFMDNPSLALRYYKLYTKERDSLNDAIKNSKYTLMTARYLADKNAQEVEILRLEIQKRNIILILLGGSLLIIILVLILYITRQKMQSQEKINELKQMALSKQMNPHFIFNAINSIHRFILENDAVASSKYLNDLALMIRKNLEISSKESVCIHEELTLIRLYLDLEKLRFKNRFEYSINEDSIRNGKDFCIPGFFIQPFIENALKHGILNTDKQGRIEISFKKKDKILECTIFDNGVGREKAQEIKNLHHEGHVAYGNELIRERLKLYKSAFPAAGFKYIDHYNDEGLSDGTSLIICIPVIKE